MTVRIRWEGKNTRGDKHWEAEGTSYQDLVETIEEKYGADVILGSHAKEIRKLEINGEDLEAYDITTDGIGEWERYEAFESRSGLKELTEDDYRSILENSDGNAYYDKFTYSEAVTFYEDGAEVSGTEGFTEDLIDYVIGEMNKREDGEAYEDLILNLEKEVKDTETLKRTLEESYNTETRYFRFESQGRK